MMKIVVSACLFGEAVRYDGRSQLLDWPVLAELQRSGRLVPFCPEVAGGLPTPRPPAECQSDGRILTCDGNDVTAAFRRGAEAALALCLREDACCALLKERSPSCGSHLIYDGQFTGRTLPGEGMTAALLRQHGIPVFSELQAAEFTAFVMAQLPNLSPKPI